MATRGGLVNTVDCNPATPEMTTRHSKRRRPWLLTGRGSSAPASIASFLVVTLLGLATTTTSATTNSARQHHHDAPSTRASSRHLLVAATTKFAPEYLSSSLLTRRSLPESLPTRPGIASSSWITLPRGGSSNDSNGYPTPPTPPHGRPDSDPYRRTDDTYVSESSAQQPPEYYAENDDNVAEHLLHETVQDRVDTWRQAQLAQSARLQQSARDDQGRMKLLTGVSRGSRAIIFVCLVFRNLHLFEVADQGLRGLARLLVVTPLIGLFVANLAGVVASFTAPTHSSKKRLKAILNLDKVLEVFLIVWNVIRLTVAPSPYVPREVHVSSVLHSVFFILQCQAFTRLTWDENAAVVPTTSSSTASTASAAASAPPSAVRLDADNFGDDFAYPSDDRWQGDDGRPNYDLDNE